MNNSELCEKAKKLESKGEIEEAYQYYLEAALAEDDGEAMYALAQMYFEGDYVRESYDKAGHYFSLAYDRNAKVEPWTLIIAGSYWENRSENNEENLIPAMKYYQVAADQGVRFGNECLGRIYYSLGEYDKAYEKLQDMDGNNPCGLYYMGRLYDEGHGVVRNMDKAIELYKQAVKSGMEVAGEYGWDDHCLMAKQRLNELGISCQSVS